MLSKRTKLSLLQYLNTTQKTLILEKHGIAHSDRYLNDRQTRQLLDDAREDALTALVDDIGRNRQVLRFNSSPEYVNDACLADLELCLTLDGLKLTENGLETLDGGATTTRIAEDATLKLIEASGLPNAEDIVREVELSGAAYMQRNFGASLVHARVAMETLMKSINAQVGGDTAATDWGAALASLRKASWLTLNEEKGIAGAYTMISDGAHRPLGPDEETFARLGRVIALEFCSFFIERWDKSHR